MRNKILKNFFYGNIHPSEKQFDRHSEYGKILAKLADEEEKLKAMLEKGASEILDRMIFLQASLINMTAEGYFIDGLRMGFQFALALLDDEESDFKTAQDSI